MLRKRHPKVELASPVLYVIAAALCLLAITTLIELFRLSPSGSWSSILFPSDMQGASNVFDGLVEVMVSLLGLTITVVSIVVQLAAQRYTPKITELFLKDRYNVWFFLFMVISSIYILLARATLHSTFIPTLSVVLVLTMMTVTLALLPVYMRYVFTQLQPNQVIRTIQMGGLDAIAGRSSRPLTIGQRQSEAIQAIDIIADISINSIAQGDRGQALHAVEALGEIFITYLESKEDLPKEWQYAPHDAFLTISEEFYREITNKNIWLEAKILMELEVIFETSLQHQVNVISSLATVIRNAGMQAILKEDATVLRLETSFFNNFCRQAINKDNLRAIYSIFYHYRLLTEHLMDSWPDLVIDVLVYLKYYGQLANKEGMPFALVIASYDLAVLCEAAYHKSFSRQRDLLEIFLQLDEDPENTAEEKANRGVRKSQAILASFYLKEQHSEYAQLIAEDMKEESIDRLTSICDEILSVHHSKFWEVTDRGSNFDFVAEERRPFLKQFFEMAIACARSHQSLS